MIRIGRRKYEKGSFTDPTYPGFKQIIVMTKSTEYGSLSPYALVDNKGRNMENIWQASKVYPSVRKSVQVFSRWNKTIIWDHPAEQHAIKNEDGTYTILPDYYHWRHKLMYNPHPVRYPVGFNHRHKCLFALKETPEGDIDPQGLNYIDARKQIYLPLFVKLVKEQKQFKELKDMLANGENLLIIEVDGPHQESLQYYKDTYGVGDDFIVNDTMSGTPENYNIMLNDPKHAFGHSYCLGIALSM